MNKIRVLQFTVAATKGGRTLYVLNNWKNINKEKFQFDFITFSKNLDFEQDLINEGCHIWHMSCYPEEDREQFINEFDHVLDNGYDVIHIHTSYWKDTIVEERAKAKGVKKIIIHAHNMGAGIALTKSEEEDIRKRHCEIRSRLTEDMATDYWGCSSEAAEWLYGNRIEKSKITLMNTAIDTERFAYDSVIRDKIRRELGLEKSFVIGNVGRFAYQKNHEFLVEVFYEIKKRIPEAILLLRGEGELQESIENRIEQLKLQKSVKIIGRTDDLGGIFSAMDVFLLPSLYEGFPAALVEAQTSGLPCIVSDSVSKETKITPLVCYRSLLVSQWVKATEDIYRKIKERKSMHLEMKAAGYDLQDQIRKIEKAYETAREGK